MRDSITSEYLQNLIFLQKLEADPDYRRRYSDFLVKRARHIGGRTLPDYRDDELRDRGVELEWRQSIARRAA